MTRRRAMIIFPVAKVAKNGKWYVEYSVRNLQTGIMNRFRIYEGFEQCSNDDERLLLSEKMVCEYRKKLESGWTPYENSKILYQNELMYANEAGISTRQCYSSNGISFYMSDFLREKKTEITPKSYETYVSKFRLFNLYLKSIGLEDASVGQVNNEIIVLFMKHIAEKKGLSRVTMDKYQQILYIFFEYLRKRKRLIIDNPVT